MKILTFGTCRVLNLFTEDNNTFLNSLHTLNYNSEGGKNIIGLTHDINQAIFILDIIRYKKNVNNIPNFKNISIKLLTRVLPSSLKTTNSPILLYFNYFKYFYCFLLIQFKEKKQ